MDTGLVVPFGRYVLKERLAQGGMGEVFRAVAVGEHGFEKPVVVKRVLPAHAGREDLTDLFVAEAKLMTKLAHPNIVEVYDFGRGEHKDYYLVLELVDGADLGRLLRAESARGTQSAMGETPKPPPQAFPIPLALFIASQVLRGLHHAHTKSAGEGAVIVHRDVSPSNVLCSLEGEVKVADFGVALVAGEGESGRGGVAGKPGYMAPEQIDGGAVDPRADVFSAGVVLHQMLTGELPFSGPTVEAQQEAARRGDRPRVPDRRPEVSEAIEAILARAMAPRAEQRFPDARAMAQAIEALRDGGQRIATGDDLAEAVRAAQRDLPAAGRKVIALTGSSAGPPSSEDAPRELTRTGAPGAVGAFTLRFPIRADTTTRQREPEGDTGARPPDRWNAPEPRTERIAAGERSLSSGEPWPPPPNSPVEIPPGSPSQTLPVASRPLPFPIEPVTGSGSVPQPVERPGPPASDEEPTSGSRPKSLRRAALVAVAAALLLAVGFAVRPHPAVPAAAPAAAASPGPAEPALGAAPSARPEVEPPIVAEPPASAPATVAAATAAKPSLRSAPGKTAAPAAPTATATGAASAPAAADCAGDVSFHSNGAWRITGGPKTVESPARLSWPCGSYTVVATSRLDATQVQTRTFSVGPMRSTVVDLR